MRIAVAIPCYNEAPAIPTVIAQFRAALPDAELVVFDNNSTDQTGAIAEALGVRVISVPAARQRPRGPGGVRQLSDFDIVVLTDGDGTYPADEVSLLIAPVRDGAADMSVGGSPAGRGPRP